MIPRNPLRCLVPIAVLFLGGCSTGTDRAFVATKTNLGLDIDSQPPTAEIAYSRRAIAIQPAFDNGGTPPILAGFRNGGSLKQTKLASLFSGGQAAILVSSNANPSASLEPAYIDLAYEPELPESFWSFKKRYPTRQPRMLVFGTDTTFGLKTSYSGPENTTLRVGYHRKEFVSAPVLARELTAADKTADTNNAWRISVPSFIANFEAKTDAEKLLNLPISSTGSVAGSAAADGGGKEKKKKKDPSEISDYFAIGAAATALAANKELTISLIRRLDPEGADFLRSEIIEKANTAGDLTKAVSTLQQQTNALSMEVAKLSSEKRKALEELRVAQSTSTDTAKEKQALSDALQLVSRPLTSTEPMDIQPLVTAVQSAGLLNRAQFAEVRSETNAAKVGAKLIDALGRATSDKVSQFLQAYTNIYGK